EDEDSGLNAQRSTPFSTEVTRLFARHPSWVPHRRPGGGQLAVPHVPYDPEEDRLPVFGAAQQLRRMGVEPILVEPDSPAQRLRAAPPRTRRMVELVGAAAGPRRRQCRARFLRFEAVTRAA